MKNPILQRLMADTGGLEPDLLKSPIIQRVWKIVTWRWRMQLALNAPFGLLWVADKTNPAVHDFDMSVLAALHAEWLAPMMGIA